jgi:hypothetical protein
MVVNFADISPTKNVLPPLFIPIISVPAELRNTKQKDTQRV